MPNLRLEKIIEEVSIDEIYNFIEFSPAINEELKT